MAELELNIKDVGFQRPTFEQWDIWLKSMWQNEILVPQNNFIHLKKWLWFCLY